MEEGVSYKSISSIAESVGIDYRSGRWVVDERCEGLDDGAGGQHGGIRVTLLTGLLHGCVLRGGGSGGDQGRIVAEVGRAPAEGARHGGALVVLAGRCRGVDQR